MKLPYLRLVPLGRYYRHVYWHEAHERKRPPDSGRKTIPEHFPRIVIEHDLPAEARMCTKCAVPHPLKRMGQETRECYRFEPPKISIEQRVRPTHVCEVRHEASITATQGTTLLRFSLADRRLSSCFPGGHVPFNSLAIGVWRNASVTPKLHSRR